MFNYKWTDFLIHPPSFPPFCTSYCRSYEFDLNSRSIQLQWSIAQYFYKCYFEFNTPISDFCIQSMHISIQVHICCSFPQPGALQQWENCNCQNGYYFQQFHVGKVAYSINEKSINGAQFLGYCFSSKQSQAKIYSSFRDQETIPKEKNNSGQGRLAFQMLLNPKV